MNKIQKLALSVIFTFFSIALFGCSGSETTISVAGPSAQTSPLSDFEFGTITEGNTAAPLEVLITNKGSERLDITDIALSDTTNFDLNIMNGSNPCLTASPALLAGESCTVEIIFQPGTTGPYLATLDIASNDANSPTKQLSLTGTSEAVSLIFNVTINQVDVACPADEITAYVSVTDQGNFPIKDLELDPNNFDITEGGVPVGAPTSSTFVGSIGDPISLAIVMDNSSSMAEIDIAEMNNAALDIIDGISPADRVEIIKFDEVIYVEQIFTFDKALLTAAINTVRDNSGTALYDAVQQAVDDTALQSSNRKAVIVITDGNDNDSSVTLNTIIANAQTKGIPVFVVALGNNINIAALQMITEGSSGEFYEADVAQNLRTILQQQVSEVLFTDQYILNYTSTANGTIDLTIDASKAIGFTGTDTRQVTLCP